jgi:L-rhamnose-H+ transport protein
MASIKEFNLVRGLVVATVSGILSACFNFGIEAGHPLALQAVERGVNPLFQNNVTFVVLLWGGLTTNFVWCMALNFRNRSFGDYADRRAPLANNYLFAGLAGTIWFLQFFFYGMGASKLSNGASSWILHMAFIIVVANLWGISLKEWRGVSRRTFAVVMAGILIILISVVLVGYGNWLVMR